MLVLATPDFDDAAYIKEMCETYDWQAHEAAWQAACETYVTEGGDPWKFDPTEFTPDIGEALGDLYDTRSQNKTLVGIRRTRRLKCCPMCGGQIGTHLDHYPPRKHFPEFSVFTPNLVPAYAECNSTNKRTIYRGNTDERFLHPYFDKLANHPLWRARVEPPDDSANFIPEPAPGFDEPTTRRIQFHLTHALGDGFARWAETEWANLPQRIRDFLDDKAVITLIDVTTALARLQRDAMTTDGLNAWLTAQLRGIRANPDAIAYLLSEAELLEPQALE